MKPKRKVASEPGVSRGDTIDIASFDLWPRSMNRRKALERFGMAFIAVAVPARWAQGVEGHGVHFLAALVTGSDSAAQVAHKSFFSPQQKAAVATLVDLLIPPDEVSPGAKAAKVEDYIDFRVANAPASEQQAWAEGLRALNQLSRAHHGGDFTALPSSQQERLLAELAREETSPRTSAGRFFVRVKHATAEGFYTSKIGLIDDLKYQGNTYVDAPATCADQFGSGPAAGVARPGNSHGAESGCPHSHGVK